MACVSNWYKSLQMLTLHTSLISAGHFPQTTYESGRRERSTLNSNAVTLPDCLTIDWLISDKIL